MVGQCSGGSPSLTGTSTVGNLSVLGVTIATDRAVSRTITIDSRSIDPSTLDPALLAPAGVDLTAFSAALRPVLDALPNIAIPEALASVRVTPAVQIRSGDTLTQRALDDPRHDRRPDRARPHRRRGQGRRGGRRLRRRRRRPGAALHQAPARADRRRPPQGPRAAVRRGRPRARRPPRVDRLHRHQAPGRAPEDRPRRPLPRHRAAPARGGPQHQPRALRREGRARSAR